MSVEGQGTGEQQGQQGTQQVDLNNPLIQEAVNKLVEDRLTAKVQEAVNKETEGLLKNRDQILAEKKQLKSQLDEIQEKIPLEELDKLLQERRESRLNQMSLEERIEEIKKEQETSYTKKQEELVKIHQTEMAEKEKKLEAMFGSLKNHMVKGTLAEEISKAGGSVDLLGPILESKIDVIPEGDGYVVRVMENGNPRIGDSNGSPMSIAQLVEECKSNPVFQPAFASSGATGGGATGQDSSNASVSSGDLKRSDMSNADRSAYIEKHGMEGYLELPA